MKHTLSSYLSDQWECEYCGATFNSPNELDKKFANNEVSEEEVLKEKERWEENYRRKRAELRREPYGGQSYRHDPKVAIAFDKPTKVASSELELNDRDRELLKSMGIAL
jgi:hypothetical protein